MRRTVLADIDQEDGQVADNGDGQGEICVCSVDRRSKEDRAEIVEHSGSIKCREWSSVMSGGWTCWCRC